LELKTRTSFTRDGVSETERAKEASFAARARETLRLALPPALDGLGRTPRLCEGLEGLVGANEKKRRAGRGRVVARRTNDFRGMYAGTEIGIGIASRALSGEAFFGE
jgi:hypothetical protein